MWDAENRLIAIKQGATTIAEYAYDAYSRRITKTVGSIETNFVYDFWNPIAEYSGTTLDKSYTWGMDLSGSMQGAGGVGGLLSVNDGSATYYPTYDGNGNVSEYVDATGAVVAHYEYGAFGQVVASGSKANDFAHQFSTKQLDSESGLHYYGYRFYDSSNGRFVGRDPIQERGGVNLYGFTANNGISHVDFLGMAVRHYDIPMGGDAIDFIDHYYDGNGREFKPDMEIIESTFSSEISQVKEKIAKAAYEEANLTATLCPDYDYDEVLKSFDSLRGQKISVNATFRNDSLGFTMGKTTFFWGYEINVYVDCCSKKWSYEGQAFYSINDRFEDPLDIGELGRKFARKIQEGAGDAVLIELGGAVLEAVIPNVEMPGATPFRIRRDWSEDVGGGNL